MAPSRKILISWIGANDLQSMSGEHNGPILSTLKFSRFDEVRFLYNYPESKVLPYLEHIKQTQSLVEDNCSAKYYDLSSPVDFGDIYKAASSHIKGLKLANNDELFILLSPGTPAMQAVWILIGKTTFNATFLQSSIEQGVSVVEIPFDISAEFIPSQALTKSIQQTMALDVPIDAAFENIVTQNHHMMDLKKKASVISKHDIPVLIQGETGTGKELFARAIHNASSRKSQPFIPVNCGAIPPELIDSTLFGYKKGAFTGALNDREGIFEQADGGTVFLDEFGELPKEAQVRLLRVLQSGEITRVGDSIAKIVNIRVIAATNRDLITEVAEGRFREDLFYRVAVGVIKLPSLTNREGDIGLLTDSLLSEINQKLSADNKGYNKKISSKGKNILVSYPWPGNIRELYATLMRAALWSQKQVISEEDISSAIFSMPLTKETILDRDMKDGFNIQMVMSEVATHYLRRSLSESNGNKTKAAQKLGLASYQTLKSWMEKYQVN